MFTGATKIEKCSTFQSSRLSAAKAVKWKTCGANLKLQDDCT